MPSAVTAAPLFFSAGLLVEMFEINSNVETDRHEALLGYRIMSRAHNLWSLGFFLTALVAAGFRQLGVSVGMHMPVVGACVSLSGAIVLSQIANAPIRETEHKAPNPALSFATIGLLPLCLVGAAPLFAEGASVDWSAIYMRDVFAVAPFVGGLAPTIFSLAIAIGRLNMDLVVDRFEARAVIVVLLLLTIFGLLAVTTAPHAYIALAGFSLMGIGCSAVYPLAISAAAKRTDRPSPVNVAALSQTTFIVFFIGPPALGFIAEH